MEETENTPTQQPIENIPAEHSENKTLIFIKKNFLVLILVVALVFVYLWGRYKVKAIERKYTEHAGRLIDMDNMKLDSMGLANTQLTTKVFGWAVRGELLRGNIEQVDIFFNHFIKEKNIERIDLIDLETQKIIKSTNKKMEDTPVANKDFITTDKQMVQSFDSTSYVIVNPVMGLDSKIGILAVTIKK
jgi:hypothetical protein